MTREQVGEWLIQTCLLWGADISTAYLVAGAFLRDLEDTSDGPRIKVK